ncbi:hypothetical protein GBAR_LOCUS12769 [Geodia barretti]|uniref:Uncharacterized protein n=1 Tax=Geodia barretti TaxID=519541 RepID=A0AA35S261_GEOBA|nr:hypothetical protein GBAR_LOCUS12769 [Geodia barretti]
MEYIERMESRGRSVLGEVKVHDNAAAFAPRREIPRTPPRLFHHQPLKPASPTVSASVKPGERDSGPRLHGKSSANPSKLGEGGCENDPPANRGSPFNQRGAQAPCFTPRKSLARSPPRPITPTTPNNAPPPTRFEIPRTPLAIKPVSPPQRKVEVHQLPRVESRTSQIQPAPAQKEPAPPKPVSPPIITADKGEKRGVGLLPEGLVCTENDLAFLQHVETIQQHQRLQGELSELDKAVKTAAQEKEQLSHQAQKIQTDVKQMVRNFFDH